jgi:hypothetical protein
VRCLRRAIVRCLAEILKNKAIACCERVSDRFTENLKNNAIACCERVSDRLAENLKNNAYRIAACR